MPLNKVQQINNEKRDKEIRFLHEVKGLTYRTIGAIYKISQERARQICNKKVNNENRT